MTEQAEEFTAEEQEALEAMEADTGEMTEAPMESAPEVPADEPEAKPEPVAKTEEAEEKPEAPEFKSQRSNDKPPEGFVPHQAMHAERVKRQELEKKIADLEAKLEPAAEAPQYADPILDPEGYRKWAEHQAAQPTNAIAEMQKQQQEQAQYVQMQHSISQSEAEFRATTPDYDDAAQFMLTARQSELLGMGYSQQEVQAQIQADVKALYEGANMLNMNPAQAAYLRAQQMGYKKAPAEPAKPDPAPATQKIQAAAHAQQQTQGANGAAGGGGTITAQMLADMSEAELAKLSPEDFERAMGG